jgi:formylglycine-generating enzyme required for sulfatase activity
VTQAQWQAKMGSNPSYFVAGNEYPGSFDRPVEQVSWDTIQSFNSATGLRLPTEAEWEYACRAGTTTARYGVLNDIAWDESNSGSTTHAVATKLPNALGLYDTLGNVLEWCHDWYEPYSSASVTNPTGPATGSFRLLRGGGWNDGSYYCRGSLRYYGDPYGAYNAVGFRAVRTP